MNSLTRFFIAALLVAVFVLDSACAQTSEGSIGYPTVAAALAALKARSDLNVSEQGGWTIVNDAANKTVWSFTPPGHPAHPTAVKRAVVEKGEAIHIDMSALCQADKSACDRLMDEFRALNQRMAQSAGPWGPSDAEKTTVERLTYQYFSAKDQGKYREAFAMLRPESARLDGWMEAAQQFNAQSGKVVDRRIRKITWHKDPPSAQLPGIYAAVDYASRFENIDLHCGYLVWHHGGDGVFRLMREEQNSIDKRTQQGLDDRALAAFKARFGC